MSCSNSVLNFTQKTDLGEVIHTQDVRAPLCRPLFFSLWSTPNQTLTFSLQRCLSVIMPVSQMGDYRQQGTICERSKNILATEVGTRPNSLPCSPCSNSFLYEWTFLLPVCPCWHRRSTVSHTTCTATLHACMQFAISPERLWSFPVWDVCRRLTMIILGWAPCRFASSQPCLQSSHADSARCQHWGAAALLPPAPAEVWHLPLATSDFFVFLPDLFFSV